MAENRITNPDHPGFHPEAPAMSGDSKAAIMPNPDGAVIERPAWRRRWCWQMGRCLVDCPIADLPRPVPMTDENWKRAYMEVVGHGR